jgi:hypothetical protein
MNDISRLKNGNECNRNEKQRYPVKDFFIDIKREIKKLVHKEINYRCLSSDFLGYVNNYRTV